MPRWGIIVGVMSTLMKSLLVLAVRRRNRVRPYDDTTQLGSREEIAVVIDEDARGVAEAELRARNWAPVAATVEVPT